MGTHVVRRLTLALPVAAVAYVVALVLIAQPAKAYIIVDRWAPHIAGEQALWWTTNFPAGQPFRVFPASTYQNMANAAYQWNYNNTGANLYMGEGGWDIYVDSLCFSCNGYRPSVPGVVSRTKNSYGEVIYADIYLNDSDGWSWNDSSCSVNFSSKWADTRVVLTHEFGHTIPLGHDGAHPEAVMWPDERCKLVTTEDDDAGTRAVWGSLVGP
jgi:hypothetical protein